MINYALDDGENMIDIKQTQYFIACAEYGSFSAAAESLFTTQSNVSKAIKALEEELELKLFERYPRGVSLTQEGERVYKYAVRVQNNMDEIMQTKMVFSVEALKRGE